MRKDHHHTLTFIKHVRVSRVSFSNYARFRKKPKKSLSSTTGIFNKDIPHAVSMKRDNLNTKIMKQNQDTSKTD